MESNGVGSESEDADGDGQSKQWDNSLRQQDGGAGVDGSGDGRLKLLQRSSNLDFPVDGLGKRQADNYDGKFSKYLNIIFKTFS